MRPTTLLVALALCLTALPARPDNLVKFDVPPQPAAQALEALASQAGLQLLFAPGDLAGLQSPGVSGALTPQEALTRLLAGTGLTFAFTAERTVAVTRAAAPQKTGAAPAPQRAELEEVGVTAAREPPYAPRSASAATRLDAPVVETPATVQVIDATLLRDRAVVSPNALADLVSGVQPVVGYGTTRSQYFLIRGFSNLGVSYRNGFKVAEVYTPRDLANVERVEFVKGPASVLYGAAQPGGAVNTVTKQALDQDLAQAVASVGSYSTARLTLDLNKHLGAFSVRLNAAGDLGDSFIDLESSRNLLVAPAARWQVTPGVTLTYDGEYQRTTRKGWSNGLLPVPGLQDLPVGTTVSEPWTTLENTNVSNHLELVVALSPGWSLRQGLYDARSWRSHKSVSPAFSADPVADGNSLTAHGRVAYTQAKDDPTNTVSQTEVRGALQTGPLTHGLLAGFEAGRSVFEFNGAYESLDVVDLTTFQPGATPPYVDGPLGGSRRTATALALYAQDLVSWRDLRLVAGLRHDWVTSSSVALPGGDRTTQDEQATTARLGALYLVGAGASVYYSFSQSFSPNTFAQAAGGGVFEAERGAQHEVGVKYAPWDGLEATASAFDIRKRNVAIPDPADPLFSVPSGEQRSRGLEVSLAGQLGRHLRLIANAAWLKTEDEYGARIFGVPDFSANAWGVVTLPLGLEAGLGLVHVGAREAAQPALDYFRLPAYTRADASLAWSGGPYRIALNVDNLNDARIINSLEGFAVLFDAPRRYTLTGEARF
ncbi:MAG: TonB-dependent receptor [Anaeromyxobacter sp.]|nr:TonB-dependent receptor [Anaeromyxobacter sp.]MBL0274878.1 TonB-dependent receptor [Anaeromyxobacter sp.]